MKEKKRKKKEKKLAALEINVIFKNPKCDAFKITLKAEMEIKCLSPALSIIELFFFHFQDTKFVGTLVLYSILRVQPKKLHP